MLQMEEKVLKEEENEKVVGGAYREDARMAKVYALDGGDVKFYHDPIEGNPPYMFAPSGSEMKVDPNMEPEGKYLFKKTEACYWACYNNRWSVLKAHEIRIEW